LILIRSWNKFQTASKPSNLKKLYKSSNLFEIVKEDVKQNILLTHISSSSKEKIALYKMSKCQIIPRNTLEFPPDARIFQNEGLLHELKSPFFNLNHYSTCIYRQISPFGNSFIPEENHPPISKKIKAFFSRQSLFPAKYKTFPSKDAHLSQNFQASFKQLIVCFVPEDRHKSTKRQAKTEQITPFSALF